LGALGADQVAVAAQDVEPIAVDGRGAARAGVIGALVLADLADLDLPRLLAVLDRQGVEKLLAVVAAQEVDLAPRDGRRGVAAAQAGGGPQEGGPALGPLLEQALLAGDPGAVRAAPLRPVGGDEGEGQERECGTTASGHGTASALGARTKGKTIAASPGE